MTAMKGPRAADSTDRSTPRAPILRLPEKPRGQLSFQTWPFLLAQLFLVDKLFGGLIRPAAAAGVEEATKATSESPPSAEEVAWTAPSVGDTVEPAESSPEQQLAESPPPEDPTPIESLASDRTVGELASAESEAFSGAGRGGSGSSNQAAPDSGGEIPDILPDLPGTDVGVGLIDNVLGTVQPVTSAVTPVVETVTDVVTGIVDGALSVVEPVTSAVAPVVETVTDVVTGVVDGALSAVEPVTAAVAPVIETVTDVATGVVDSALTAVDVGDFLGSSGSLTFGEASSSEQDNSVFAGGQYTDLGIALNNGSADAGIPVPDSTAPESSASISVVDSDGTNEDEQVLPPAQDITTSALASATGLVDELGLRGGDGLL